VARETPLARHWTRRSLLQLALALFDSGSTRAQQAGRVFRLGCLFSAPKNAPHEVALAEGLRHSGFIEGQNLSLDQGGYGLRLDQFDEHAAELVRSGVDVILAGGDPAVRAAQRATNTIPILALTDDLLGQGFVRSLAKPGGNTTGVTILASQLDGKRQDLLIQTLPNMRQIAGLADSNTTSPLHLNTLNESARAHGVELSVYPVSRVKEIVPAINQAHASGAKGLNVLASALFFNNRTIIFDRAMELGLPAIYQWPEMVDEGGLMGYGPSIVQLYRDVQTRQLVAILNGTKPADIPVEQPTKFELVINLATAKALGLSLPPGVLFDRVIEQ
jgi:putative tryptophan/tyrosine transport system substrate-binding protein